MAEARLGMVDVGLCCSIWTTEGFSFLPCQETFISPNFTLQSLRIVCNISVMKRQNYSGLLKIKSKTLSDPEAIVSYKMSILTKHKLNQHRRGTFKSKSTVTECTPIEMRFEPGLDVLQVHVKVWKGGFAENGCPHELEEAMSVSSTDCQDDPLTPAFEKWYLNSHLTDMLVEVGKQEFIIHKFVFATRSPVFNRMFEHNMSESNTGHLVINDCDPQVFKRLVEYIYTGRVEGLQDFAFELLKVAEKYELEHLKTLCERAISTLLSVDNAVDVLSLAYIYRSPKLKEVAMDLIKIHLQAVTRSEGWNTLLLSNKDLVNEMITYLVGEIVVSTSDQPPNNK